MPAKKSPYTGLWRDNFDENGSHLDCRRPRANAAAQQRIDALKKRGGRIERASVRKDAELIRRRRSTVHAALGMLVAAGTDVKAGRTLTLAGYVSRRRDRSTRQRDPMTGARAGYHRAKT